MFDASFSELIVIGVVALVVIGPERLPKVARTAGHLLGRMQRYVNDVKADISREMQLDELKKLQAEMQDSARSFKDSISSELQAIEHQVDPSTPSVQVTSNDPAAPGGTMTPLATGSATTAADPASLPVSPPAPPDLRA